MQQGQHVISSCSLGHEMVIRSVNAFILEIRTYQSPLKTNMSFPNGISVKSTNGLATKVAMTHKSHSDSEP